MKLKGIYEKGNKWQVKKTFPGRPQITGMFITYQQAEAFILECEAAHKVGKPFPSAERSAAASASGAVTTLQAVYETAVDTVWSGNSDSASAEAARVFVAWAGPLADPSQVLTEAKIIAYMAARRKQGNTGSTINRKLSGVKGLLKVAKRLKLIAEMPELTRQKEGEPRERYYTMEEQRIILEMSRKLGDDQYADLWQVLADTGARPLELKQVKWAELRNGQVTLSCMKGGRKLTRAVPLTPAAMEAIERRRNCPKFGYMAGPFTWATKMRITDKWRTLRRSLAWLDDECVPYTFRHTCDSRLAMAGHSAPMIMSWMGHTNIVTTQRYMHLSPASIGGLVNTLAKFEDPTHERRAVA